MLHIRQQVKYAIASLLKVDMVEYESVLETRLQSSRQIWPYLLVYSTGDTVESVAATDPNIYLRQINITVVGMLRINNDNLEIEQIMDAFCLEVESKLISSNLRALVPQFESFSMVSTNLDIIVTEDDAIDHAEATMNFVVTCANSETSPSVLI